jgi:hypothetical protein
VVEAKRLIRTVTTTRQEDVEVAPPVEKEAWQLPNSIFALRAKRGPMQCGAFLLPWCLAVQPKSTEGLLAYHLCHQRPRRLSPLGTPACRREGLL